MFGVSFPSPSQGEVLNWQQAQSRLQNLDPSSEEHRKLQGVLARCAGIFEINLPDMTYKVNTVSHHCILLGGFGSSEHVDIGEAVRLKGLQPDEPLLVKGTSPVRFPHIVALAGDFYGIAGQAISLPGGTTHEKRQRFIHAFNTLALPGNEEEVRKILGEIEQECFAVKHSSLPHHCYSNQMMEKHAAIKRIKGDVEELLVDNSDHFSLNAEEAYLIGHTLALEKAREAGAKQDLNGLKLAYAMDAFACHFLTDLFAAGHIRNQRGPLETALVQLGFELQWAKKFAGLLTGAQHEKDGHEGLNVSNHRGDYWRAYGDGNYFAHKNNQNKKQAILATQTSVDEIHDAYNNPEALPNSRVTDLIPHATPLNPLPIYFVENGQLFLYRGHEKIAIQTKYDYCTKAISHALRYLPENYVMGFIKGQIPLTFETPPILEKVVIPLMDSLTGSVWRIVGIASHKQVAHESKKINEKIDEMAERVMGTYEHSVQILHQINELSVQVDELAWNDLLKEIRDPISVIKDIIHEQKYYEIESKKARLKEALSKVWDAHIRLGRVFTEGTASSKNLLLVYQTSLKKNQTMSPEEIKIAVTLWFRQMLEYQVQAFCIYQALQGRRDEEDRQIQSDLLAFEFVILKQIQANNEFIDEQFIYENQDFISVQLQKAKVHRLMNQQSSITLLGSNDDVSNE